MPGRARRLLVGGEQRVLESGDERAPFDSLVALDLANGFDDFLAHGSYLSSIRLPRTIVSYGMSVGSPVPVTSWNERSPAERPRRGDVESPTLQLHLAAEGALEVGAGAERPVKAG